MYANSTPGSLLDEVSTGKKRDHCQHPSTLFDKAAVQNLGRFNQF